MMMSALLSMAASVAGVPAEPPTSIQTPVYNIMGFYCSDPVCDRMPRPLVRSLAFDPVAGAAMLAAAPRSGDRWSVSLNCRVVGDRLSTCRLDRPNDATKAAGALALQVAGRIRLAGADPASPRAILFIDFDTGPCPIWRCTMTPPPPPPLKG